MRTQYDQTPPARKTPGLSRDMLERLAAAEWAWEIRDSRQGGTRRVTGR